MILVVAATREELRGAESASTLVCGVGPVEAAARTAAALAGGAPDAVLHVGLAGGRTFEQPVFVVGSEAVYCDADDPRWIELRLAADPGLVDAAHRALPAARVEPIGTTARVGGSVSSRSANCEVEAMEGYAVLRAAALAGVPAVEVRVLSNVVGEPDRAKWRFDDAKDALAGALPKLIQEVSRAHA